MKEIILMMMMMILGYTMLDWSTPTLLSWVEGIPVRFASIKRFTN
jgi:hypothetical protein